MNDKCLLSSTGLLTALDKRPAVRLARGHDGANLFYLWTKFRQKEKLKLFKIRKLNGFGGFQSPDVRKIIMRNR
jgi:hypothetical protein